MRCLTAFNGGSGGRRTREPDGVNISVVCAGVNTARERKNFIIKFSLKTVHFITPFSVRSGDIIT